MKTPVKLENKVSDKAGIEVHVSILRHLVFVAGIFGLAVEANAQAFLLNCINGGTYVSQELANQRIGSALYHKALVTDKSVVPIASATTADGEVFMDKNAKKKKSIVGSGVVVACDIVLTAGHNAMLNPDLLTKDSTGKTEKEKNLKNFSVVLSKDIFTDMNSGILKKAPIRDFEVHDDYLRNFESRKFTSLDEAAAALDSDEFLVNDFALVKVDRAQLVGYQPMKLAPLETVEQVSRESGRTVTVAGFGAENPSARVLGQAKFADMASLAPTVQPAAGGALSPLVLVRKSGATCTGDSGGAAFVTEVRDGVITSSLVGMNASGQGDCQSGTKVSLLDAKVRKALSEMFKKLGSSCPEQNPFEPAGPRKNVAELRR